MIVSGSRPAASYAVDPIAASVAATQRAVLYISARHDESATATTAHRPLDVDRLYPNLRPAPRPMRARLVAAAAAAFRHAFAHA